MTEMEGLARELAGWVVTRAPGAWLQSHGLRVGTLAQDASRCRADLRARIAAASRADAGVGPRPEGAHRACPFCGAPAAAFLDAHCHADDPRVPDADRARVECTGCCAGVYAYGDTYEEAEARALRWWDDRDGGSNAWVGPADEDDEFWEGDDD